jgi:trimeric autotransporter adhesin
MASTRGVARLGMLAVGLGVVVAVAHSPGVASADSSSDWLSSIDSLLGGGALPAPSSGLDLAISFNGVSLLQDGSANAFTTSGGYDLAIAYGANSHAEAVDGTGDTAIASGSSAAANAYDGTGDYALADGTNAFADSGGATGANYDSAIDIGNNTNAHDGAYAGSSDLNGGTDGGTGSYDTAIDIGNNTNDASLSGNDGAFAGAGGLDGFSGNGNNDTAIDVGNNSGQYDGSFAINGNGNYASESGSTTGSGDGALAGFGNDNTAVADTSYTANGDRADALSGNDNYASVLGPENSTATAEGGDSNIAYVLDPFGSTASQAFSGDGFNSDLAALLFADGNATASGANYLYDILTAFGLESGTF